MFGFTNACMMDIPSKYYTMEDYASDNQPRWCSGCGDLAIYTSVQRLCREEQLKPEKLVFVSGIGCSSRFPHYINAYGIHTLHGRALPIAEGIKIRRPDLDVFVTTGDGDCCSIGASHWIHAIRYNMDMTVMMHNNQIYALTKNQTAPTSHKGLKTNTNPYGAPLEPVNPLRTCLGMVNVSFVAQAVEWIPDLLYAVLEEAYHHKGFSFVQILQRCTAYFPKMYDHLQNNPENLVLLKHPDGIHLDDTVAGIFKSQEDHDQSDLHQAFNAAMRTDKVPVGILYRNENVPCYEDLRRPSRVFTNKMREEIMNKEFDRFAV